MRRCWPEECTAATSARGSYEPTILADVPNEARVAREETFGPVVEVYRVASDDEAVAAMNDTEFGLNASIWTGTPAAVLPWPRACARGR